MSVPTATPSSTAHASWHAINKETVLEQLRVTTSGPGETEAVRRLEAYGPNLLPQRQQPAYIALFLRQFRSPLITLLMAAALLSLAIGDAADAGFITVALMLNAAIGAFQEGRTASTAKEHQQLIRQTARVRRDGVLREVEGETLVPGDIIEVESGMRMAADARQSIQGAQNVALFTMVIFQNFYVLALRSPAGLARLPGRQSLGDRG